MYALGPAMTVDFARQIRRSAGDVFLTHVLNISLSAVISRIFWLAAGRHVSAVVDLVRLSLIAAGVLATLWVCVRASITATRRGEPGKSLSVWLTVCVLVTPVNWFHHMVLLLLPFSEIARATGTFTAAARFAVASYGVAEVALILLWIRWWSWPLLAYPLQNSIAMSAFVSLVLCLAGAYVFATTKDAAGEPLSSEPPQMRS